MFVQDVHIPIRTVNKEEFPLPENRHLRLLLTLLYILLGLAALWLGLHYLLPWFLPFLIGLALAGAIQRPAAWLSRRCGLRRNVCSVLLTALELVLVFALAALIVWRGIYELERLFRKLPQLLEQLPTATSSLEVRIYRYIISMPSSVQEMLFSALDALLKQGMSIPEKLYTWLADFLSALVTLAPAALLFVITTCLAALFMAADYQGVKDFVLRQFPEKWQGRVRRGKGHIKTTFRQWLKAQIILTLVTFGELAIGLLLLRVDYALLLALVIAIVDALPVFGTGTVLIPWAVVSLILGRGEMALSLLLLYGFVTVIRRILEPKLISSSMGLSPLGTLIALYVGYKAMGVLGMILAPVLLLLLKELRDREYLKLWK